MKTKIFFFLFFGLIIFFGLSKSAKAQTSQSLPTIGLQASDRVCGAQAGAKLFTSSTGGGTGRLSDSNNFQPDCLSIFLGKAAYDPSDTTVRFTRDFRIGIRFWNKDAPTIPSTFALTNWASEGGGWSTQGWSVPATHIDYYELYLESQEMPSNVDYVDNVKLEVQLAGRSSSSYCNTTSGGINNTQGGWSGWAYGGDTPDCAAVHLTATAHAPGTVNPTGCSITSPLASVDANNPDDPSPYPYLDRNNINLSFRLDGNFNWQIYDHQSDTVIASGVSGIDTITISLGNKVGNKVDQEVYSFIYTITCGDDARDAGFEIQRPLRPQCVSPNPNGPAVDSGAPVTFTVDTTTGDGVTYSWNASANWQPTGQAGGIDLASGDGTTFRTHFTNTSTISPDTFTVHVGSANQTGSCTVLVNSSIPPVPPPSVTIEANDTIGTYDMDSPSGGAIKISWIVKNVDSCIASNSKNNPDWSGNIAAIENNQNNDTSVRHNKNDTSPGVNLTGAYAQSTTFTVNCTQNATSGSVSRIVSSSVSVNIPGQPPAMPPPTVTLTADSTTVRSGDTTVIRWSITNASACTGTNMPSGNWSSPNISGTVSGSNRTGELTNPSNSFALSCSNSGGTTSQTVNVTVTQTPTAWFTANNATYVVVNVDDNITYRWGSTNATAGSAVVSGISGPGGATRDSCDNELGPASVRSITGTSGTHLQAIALCQAGFSYAITYTATGPGGSSDPKTVYIVVNQVAGTTSSNTPCTSNCPVVPPSMNCSIGPTTLTASPSIVPNGGQVSLSGTANNGCDGYSISVVCDLTTSGGSPLDDLSSWSGTKYPPFAVVNITKTTIFLASCHTTGSTGVVSIQYNNPLNVSVTVTVQKADFGVFISPETETVKRGEQASFKIWADCSNHPEWATSTLSTYIGGGLPDGFTLGTTTPFQLPCSKDSEQNSVTITGETGGVTDPSIGVKYSVSAAAKAPTWWVEASTPPRKSIAYSTNNAINAVTYFTVTNPPDNTAFRPAKCVTTRSYGGGGYPSDSWVGFTDNNFNETGYTLWRSGPKNNLPNNIPSSTYNNRVYYAIPRSPPPIFPTVPGPSGDFGPDDPDDPNDPYFIKTKGEAESATDINFNYAPTDIDTLPGDGYSYILTVNYSGLPNTITPQVFGGQWPQGGGQEKIPGCPDFDITATPPNQPVEEGQTTGFTIVATTINDFDSANPLSNNPSNVNLTITILSSTIFGGIQNGLSCPPSFPTPNPSDRDDHSTYVPFICTLSSGALTPPNNYTGTLTVTLDGNYFANGGTRDDIILKVVGTQSFSVPCGATACPRTLTHYKTVSVTPLPQNSAPILSLTCPAGPLVDTTEGTAVTADLYVNNTGSGEFDWTASDDAFWLELTNPGSSNLQNGSPRWVGLTARHAGMLVGTYKATVTVAAPEAINSPQTCPVVLNLTGGGGVRPGAPSAAISCEVDGDPREPCNIRPGEILDLKNNSTP